jgi:hypothetical protein
MNGGALLKTLKNDSDIGLSEHLKLTCQQLQRPRTRWRMHRVPIASHFYDIHMTESPLCQQCRMNPPPNEDDEHALLHCSKHTSIRNDMLSTLRQHIPDIQISIPLILGSRHAIEQYTYSENIKKIIYNITGTFIKLLLENRVVAPH